MVHFPSQLVNVDLNDPADYDCDRAIAARRPILPRRVTTHVRPVGAHSYVLGAVRTDGRALVEGVLGKYVQINIVTLFNLLPDETTQNLHQDGGLWPIPRPHPELVCNALIAIDDFDVENGATNIVPYSHTWHDRPMDQSVETLQVTMRSGSMLVWAGNLWHAAGANNSRDRERLGLFMRHNVSYLRQQDNQVIAVPREVAKQMPKKLQRLLGYFPFGGGIDFRDPIDVLRDGAVINPAAQVARRGWGKL